MNEASCGRCGAPYQTQYGGWWGIMPPPVTPSCCCWNFMPVMTTSSACVFAAFSTWRDGQLVYDDFEVEEPEYSQEPGDVCVKCQQTRECHQ